jgi:hypothetical protein
MEQIKVVIILLPTASQRKKDLVSLGNTQEIIMQMAHLFIQDLNLLLL